MTASRPTVTPSRRVTPAPSQQFGPMAMPRDGACLVDDGDVGPRHVVAPSDQVGIGRDQGVAAAPHAAGGEEHTERTDVDAVLQHDVAVLGRHNGLAAEEDAVAYRDAVVGCALRIEHAAVVDHHVVPDTNLVRVAQRHVASEEYVPAAGAEQLRIKTGSQPESEGPRCAASEQGDQLIAQQGAPAPPPDDELLVLLSLAAGGVENLSRNVIDLHNHGLKPILHHASMRDRFPGAGFVIDRAGRHPARLRFGG